MKVNLPGFKDEKMKDAVTYHSCGSQDMTIFHCSGWNDQHLLPYVLQVAIRVPGRPC